jgi:hypothetical protein
MSSKQTPKHATDAAAYTQHNKNNKHINYLQQSINQSKQKLHRLNVKNRVHSIIEIYFLFPNINNQSQQQQQQLFIVIIPLSSCDHQLCNNIYHCKLAATTAAFFMLDLSLNQIQTSENKTKNKQTTGKYI